MPFVVQEANNYSPGSTTNTLAWPSTPTAGNLLFVMYGANGSSNPSSVTDGGGAGSYTYHMNRTGNSLVAAAYSRTATGTETSVVATTAASAFSMIAIFELDSSRITAWKSRGASTPTSPTFISNPSPGWYRFLVNHFNTGSTPSNGGIGFVVQNGSSTIDAPPAASIPSPLTGDETYYTGLSAATLSIGYYSVDLYTSSLTYSRYVETTSTSSALTFGNVFTGPAPASGTEVLRRRRE